jgi:hypothetical protein
MTPQRRERFRRDVSEMKLKTGNEKRERLLQVVGAAMMVVGIGVGFVTYQASLNMSDVRDVESSMILTVVMLAVAVAGAALFLTFTLTRFLRLWLLRQLYEGQAHVDDVVDGLARRDVDLVGTGNGRDVATSGDTAPPVAAGPDLTKAPDAGR